MEPFEERPDVKWDRWVCLGAAAAAVAGACWVLWQMYRDPYGLQTVRLIILFSLLALAGHLGRLAYLLSPVCYSVHAGSLGLSHRMKKSEVRLDQVVHLARWRYRWIWSGNLQAELGVEDVQFFPPVWFLGPQPVWVLVYGSQEGTKHAVALRPSSRLLKALRTGKQHSRAQGN